MVKAFPVEHKEMVDKGAGDSWTALEAVVPHRGNSLVGTFWKFLRQKKRTRWRKVKSFVFVRGRAFFQEVNQGGRFSVKLLSLLQFV